MKTMRFPERPSRRQLTLLSCSKMKRKKLDRGFSRCHEIGKFIFDKDNNTADSLLAVDNQLRAWA